MTKKFTDLEKFKIVESEYKLVAQEIKEAYNIIQQRVSLVLAAYAFIFSSYITAISQWDELKTSIGLMTIIFILLTLAFIPLIPASLLTVLKKWQSFGNPRNSVKILKNCESIKLNYYSSKIDDWRDTIKNNKNINKWINILLLTSLILIALSMMLIFFQIFLVVILTKPCQI